MRGLVIDPVVLNVPLFGSYISAEARAADPSVPPVRRMRPSESGVAVWRARMLVIEPVGLKVPVAGSYSSAEARADDPFERPRREPDRPTSALRCGGADAHHRAGRAEGAALRIVELGRSEIRRAVIPSRDENAAVGSNVAVLQYRAVVIEPVGLKVPVAGSYSSAEASRNLRNEYSPVVKQRGVGPGDRPPSSRSG